MRATSEELVRVRSETLRATRRNAELASELLRLADEAKAAQRSGLESQMGEGEAEPLRKELAASRQKWKVMKGVASAIVAGSGVDWAADAELREVVLDEDED